MSALDRRAFVAGQAGAAAMQFASPFAVAARTSHTLKLGEYEIGVISDGHLAIPTRFLARNASEVDIKALLGVSADVVTPPWNITPLRTLSDVILVDVGAGAHVMTSAGSP